MNIGAAAIKTTILFEISPKKVIDRSPDEGGATKQSLLKEMASSSRCDGIPRHDIRINFV